jgi:hypothetical protein
MPDTGPENMTNYIAHLPPKTARDFVNGLITARFGERFTFTHCLTFGALFYYFMIRLQFSGFVLPISQGMIPDAGIETHPHLVGFPILLQLLRLDDASAYIAYPTLLTLSLPALWVYLVIRHRVPLLIATCLMLATIQSPIISHVGITPNTDFLTAWLTTATALLVLEKPHARWWHFVFFLMAMMTHQRSLVLVPGLVMLAVATAYPAPHQSPRMAWRTYLIASVPFAAAAIVFFVFKEAYFHVYPVTGVAREITFLEQFNRVFRPEMAIDKMQGGPFAYIFSIDNVIHNGLYYFSFLIAFWGMVRLRDYGAASVPILLHFGIISQLLVAEDIHRLTGFILVITLLLAIWSARSDWPYPRMTIAFFAVGTFTLYIRNLKRAFDLLSGSVA